LIIDDLKIFKQKSGEISSFLFQWVADLLFKPGQGMFLPVKMPSVTS
jgi:hypothetical protein